MRKKMTLLNSAAGLINRIITIVFVFLVRHYFTKYLFVEYLGFEGFFQNVLGLFSLVDLGLGTAISFDLYEPIHNKERDQIGSILQLYKKLYSLVGIVIFGLSLCFVPFIMNFMKDVTVPDDEVKLYFLIYAMGVSISYFFSYKRTLIFASQKNHIIMNVDSATKIVVSMIQIFALIVLHNYTVYLVAIVLTNLAANIVLSKIADAGNYYDKGPAKPLPEQFKNKLKKHVSALAITNISWQGIASTDNILISSVVGVIDLAKNANYTTISHSINSIISSVLGGVSASIGDLLVEKDKKKIKDYFDRYCFIYFIVTSYASLGIMFVSDSVISLWVGKDLVYDWLPVFLISINVFLTLNFKPLVDYQNFSGSFVYYKPYSIIALIINLVTSIIFGKLLGVAGVFLGTTITYMFMNITVACIIYKHIFEENVIDYFKNALLNCIPLLVSFCILFLVNKAFVIASSIIEFIAKLFLVTIVYGSSVVLFLRKNKNYVYFKSYYLTLLEKVKRKARDRQ